jgi:serine/threonine-protein kinase
MPQTDLREQLVDALSARYAVERLIGAGGMATVYLARDLRHDRQVALKVLNPELGAVLGADRFLAEIKVTANLQHPNLLPLFDSGDADGLLFYVMPYVEGESLRTRLDRERQLPIAEAVRYTTAVASALDYAHRRGVIHRDLKPENILLHEGQPLVADFGIALAVSNAGGNRITQSGLSLGTPQYMSPEQATGDRVIDARTDIYSLGAVLYEMLVGDPPHMGSTAQAVIAKVLTEKAPHVRASRDTVPENVDRAIEQALAKLPADRFATVAKFAEALETTSGATTIGWTSSSTRKRSTRSRVFSSWPWIAGLVTAIGIGLWGSFRSRQEFSPTVRFNVDLADQTRTTGVFGMALSPDGSMLVYGSPEGLVTRSMADPQLHLIAGTVGAGGPFFSPDGRWIGFLAGTQLKKVPSAGGSTVILMDSVHVIPGGSWNDRGDLVVQGPQHALVVIPSGGGAPRILAKPAAGERYLWPKFLPNGKGILFSIWRGALQTAELATTTLDGKVSRLGIHGVGGHYADGNLFYAHADGSLAMVSFNPNTLRAGSDERALGETIEVSNPGATNYAVTTSGSLAFLRGASNNQPVIVDRHGGFQSLALEPRTYARPRFSPDGKRILFDTRSAAYGEIWLYDLHSSTPQRVFAGEDVHQPEWRPDGRAILFTARNDTTQEDIFTLPLDGTSRAQVVMRMEGDQYDATWAPDGKSLVYVGDDTYQTFNTVNIIDPKPVKWLESVSGDATLLGPRISPDGKWIAYWGSQSGRDEVFVRPFPGNGSVLQVSSDGGTEPVWSKTGHDLYYRHEDKLMMATFSTNPEITVANRQLLFTQQFAADGQHAFYDVRPDGSSFIFLKSSDRQAQITVVLNWTADLKRKVPKP